MLELRLLRSWAVPFAETYMYASSLAIAISIGVFSVE